MAPCCGRDAGSRELGGHSPRPPLGAPRGCVRLQQQSWQGICGSRQWPLLLCRARLCPPVAAALGGTLLVTSLTPAPQWSPCVLMSASCSSHVGCLLAVSLQCAIKKAPAPFKAAVFFPDSIVAQLLRGCVQGEQPLSSPGFHKHPHVCRGICTASRSFWLQRNSSLRSLVCALSHPIQGQLLQAWK